MSTRKLKPTARQRIANQNYRALFARTATAPKRDALEKAMAGVAPDYAQGNPAVDPGWRTPEEHERARLTAVILADYEQSMVPPDDLIGAYTRDGAEVTFKDGSRANIHDLIDAQRRAAYELLKKRVDQKAIAAMLLRPESWVEALRQEFNL